MSRKVLQRSRFDQKLQDQDVAITKQQLEQARSLDSPVGDNSQFSVVQATKHEVSRAWISRAACRDEETEIFYANTTRKVYIERIDAICGGCAVRAACFEYAVLTEQTNGFWGGVRFNKKNLAKRKERLKRGGALY